jgi:hypothetical protein
VLEVFIMPEDNNVQGRVYRPNTFQMPNVMIDQWLTELSGSEFKVAAYICRHTYGWNKESDGISLSQMMNGVRRRDGTYLDRGTGIKSKETLLTGLRSLEKQGRIRRDRRRSIERGDEPTVYRLVIVDEEPLEAELSPGEGAGLKTGHPVGGKSDQGGGENFRPGGWAENPPTQNTLEQNTSLQNPSKPSNTFELQSQVLNGVATFQNSKNEIEFLKNDESEEDASADEPEEQRRGNYQPLTPSTNSFTAVGEVLKGRRVGTGRKSAPRSSKTASTAASSARADVRQGKGKTGLPEPPEWLREHITRLSDELHDLSHAEGNIGQAHNLFLYTGAEERRFRDRLIEAKRLTLKYDIEKRAEGEAGEVFGQRNKMPYFFKVLRDVLGLKDIPASETKPVSAKRKGRGQNVNEQFYSP